MAGLESRRDPSSGDPIEASTTRRAPLHVLRWLVVSVIGAIVVLVAVGAGTIIWAINQVNIDLSGDCSQSNLPLNRAVAANDRTDVVRTIGQGADPNRVDTDGRSPLDSALPIGIDGLLQQAAGSSDDPGADARARTMVATLLAHGADPNGRPFERPVVNAFWAGDPTTAALLMRHADLGLPYGSGHVRVADAALAMAAQDGDAEEVRTLLASGADPDRTDLMTPLMRASFYGHDDAVALLLDHGADPDVGRGDQEICFGPLFAGITQGASLATAAGVCTSNNGSTPRSTTTGTAGTSDVGDNLDGAPDGTPFRASPVSAAVAGGHLPTLRLLLDHGARVDGPALGDLSAMSLAIKACDPNIAAELVAHHAALTASDRRGACRAVAAVLPH